MENEYLPVSHERCYRIRTGVVSLKQSLPDAKELEINLDSEIQRGGEDYET
jgi:hypothetical protein